MTECPWCHAENPDGRAYCARCGRGFSGTIPAGAEQQRGSTGGQPVTAAQRGTTGCLYVSAWLTWAAAIVTALLLFVAFRNAAQYDSQHDLVQGKSLGVAVFALFFLGTSSGIVLIMTLLASGGASRLKQAPFGCLVLLVAQFVPGLPWLAVMAWAPYELYRKRPGPEAD
ncbi:MAG: hypothetical protein AB7H85_08795 [Dehalococcoidia bacterium]